MANLRPALRRRGKQAACMTVLGLLLSVLVWAVPTALADNAVSELSSRHWSLSQLAVLVKAGWVDARTFPGEGSRGVTRLEVALAVSQALGNLRAAVGTTGQGNATGEIDLGHLIVAAGGAPSRGRNLGPRETEALRRLVVEFSPELEILGIKVAVGAESPVIEGELVDGSAFVDLDLLVTELAEGSDVSEPSIDALAVARVADGTEAATRTQSETSVGTPAETGQETVVHLVKDVFSAGKDANATLLPASHQAGNLHPTDTSIDEQLTVDSTLAKNRVLAVDAQLSATPKSVTALKHEFVLQPSLKVSSEFLANPKASPETGAVSLEAAVKLGEMKLGANLRNVSGLQSPLVQAVDAQDKQGYDLSLKLGKVTLSTGYEKVTSAAETQNLRQIGVNYSFSDLATLRAGYEFVDIDSVSPRSKANTVVGVDFALSDKATIKADVKLEGPGENSTVFDGSEGQKASAGVELRLPFNAKLTAGYELYRQPVAGADDSVQQTTSIGLGYNFMQNATLLLGYRLIDFGSGSVGKDQQSDLTAGVSVRF